MNGFRSSKCISRLLTARPIRSQNGTYRLNSNSIQPTSITTTDSSTAKIPLWKRWADSCKAILTDYKEVFVGVGTAMKENPVKTALYSSALVSVIYCYKTNPDERHYRDSIIQRSNDINRISEAIRNPVALSYLEEIEFAYNCGEIRRIDVGLFSVMLNKNTNNDISLFSYKCNLLQPTYIELFKEHILDVGFLNKWWCLEKAMIDYDVRPDEWPHEELEEEKSNFISKISLNLKKFYQ